jgi:hypothetical protein
VIQQQKFLVPNVNVQDITQEMKNFKAYTTMRVVRSKVCVDGHRTAVVNRKKKELVIQYK